MKSFAVSQALLPDDAVCAANSGPRTTFAWTSIILPKSIGEAAGQQTRALQVVTNRMTAHRVTPLDLVPPSSMRAPSTTGQPIFESTIDAMAKGRAVDGMVFDILRSGGIVNDSIHGGLRGHPTGPDKFSHGLHQQT